MGSVNTQGAFAPAGSIARQMRLRPGERPTWWDGSVDRGHWTNWRREATRRRLPLDVWVALLLELALVTQDLERAGVGDPQHVLLAAVNEAEDELRLPPRAELRPWLALLSAGALHDEDELPEVVLPTRLAHRLRPGSPLTPLLRQEDLEIARRCDAAAASHGRTLRGVGIRCCSSCRRLGDPPQHSRSVIRDK